jgi:LPS export ABC transporter protein LptC
VKSKSISQFPNFLFVIVLPLGFIGCHEATKSLEEMKVYNGPLTTMNDVVNYFSDSAIVKIKLTTPVQLEMKNGDKKFPKGLKVEFFERDGSISSVMTANKGVFTNTTKIFKATGNVVVNQILKGETLNTEELNWDQNGKKIFTDKFVTITTEDELLQGTGLTAAEDFSTYRITEPRGNFTLDDEDEEEDSVSEE